MTNVYHRVSGQCDTLWLAVLFASRARETTVSAGIIRDTSVFRDEEYVRHVCTECLADVHKKRALAALFS